MFSAFRKISRQPLLLLALALLISFLFAGCAAQCISQTSFNRSLIEGENVQRVAVLSFESPPDDPQAGSHISQLFEMHLLSTGLYRISERGGVEKALRELGFNKSVGVNPATLRQLRELIQVDGLILGSVSHYNRVNFGFTARLVSLKSGLVLWSVSQTGGRILRPLSQVADESVEAAVKDLQSKIR